MDGVSTPDWIILIYSGKIRDNVEKIFFLKKKKKKRKEKKKIREVTK